jgi:hypothetical protein
MSIHSFAVLKAETCDDDFGRLILDIPAAISDGEVARKAISTVSFASSMAKNCGSTPAAGMIFSTAEKLCQTIERESFEVQYDAVNRLVRNLSFVSSMARITPEVASEMFNVVRPIVERRLPTTLGQIEQLGLDLRQVDAAIRNLTQAATMRRIVGNQTKNA